MIGWRQSSKFLRLWALAILVGVLLMGSLVMATFGLVSFGALLFLWFREVRTRPMTRVDLLQGSMLGLSTLWFLVNLVLDFGPIEWTGWSLVIAFLFPPLLLDLYAAEAEYRPALIAWMIRVAYAGGVTASAATAYVMLAEWGPDTAAVFWWLMVTLSGLFAWAGFGSVYILSRSRVSSRETLRELRQVNIGLLVALVLTCGAMLLSWWLRGEVFEAVWPYVFLLPRAMPLLFLFFNSYYEESFQFFDVFVKRATFFFLALVGLVAYFRLMHALLPRLELAPRMETWIYVLTLLPLVMWAPSWWAHLESFMDRHWLGRRFSALEAIEEFLERARSTRDRQELLAGTEAVLQDLFRTQVQVVIDPDDPPARFDVALRVPIETSQGRIGEIRLGPRPNQAPYFQADRTLISTLGEVLSYLLEGLKLQEELREQERKEKELAVEVGRARLQAIRAQINPHFFFNALNAIASLTHLDPDQAERTVELLADVFRYALTRAQTEWVTLEEEVDFIRSYLAVEQVRFGKRLQVEFAVAPAARNCRIPTMAIQTLVENAVKHGIARSREAGRIRLEARVEGGRLVVLVTDTGPGRPETEDEERNTSGTGFGLASLQSRLRAYFDDAADFELRRDEERQETVAILRLPAQVEEAAGLRETS
ncbi:MAG: hypothetical protein Kow00109_09770 [Acidobacteriota bacterium]